MADRMPQKRTARRKSESGIYHVILRGMNRQQIFYDEEDYEYSLSLLERFQDVSHYELYAYCLMGNHIHLLLKTGEEPLDRIFRRIGASFPGSLQKRACGKQSIFSDRAAVYPPESCESRLMR